MIAAAAGAAVLTFAHPGVSPAASFWTSQVMQLVSQGARLCLSVRSTAALAAAAPAYGARPQTSALGRADSRPVWLLGPRGEVQVAPLDGYEGFRCTVYAATGEASGLVRALPDLARALGFARTPTTPARWPGEAAYRGRSGAALGAYLFTASPLIHGAGYGAMLVVGRSPS